MSIILFTTFFLNYTGEAGANAYIKNNKIDPSTLLEYNHSHPDGETYPSGRVPQGVDIDRGGDISIAKKLEFSFPNIKFSIYTPLDGKYTRLLINGVHLKIYRDEKIQRIINFFKTQKQENADRRNSPWL